MDNLETYVIDTITLEINTYPVATLETYIISDIEFENILN